MMHHEMNRSLKARGGTYHLKKEPVSKVITMDKILIVCIILFICISSVLCQDYIGLIALE